MIKLYKHNTNKHKTDEQFVPSVYIKIYKLAFPYNQSITNHSSNFIKLHFFYYIYLSRYRMIFNKIFGKVHKYVLYRN